MRAFLFLFVISFAWNVCAQLPDEPLKKADAAKQQTKADKQGTEQSPIVVKVIPPTIDDKKSAEEEKKQEEKSASDWWLVKLTAVLAVIGLLQLFVFGMQARRLRQTIEEMRVATKATEKAANAAEWSAKLARDEFDASHRAWVKCDVSLAVASPDQHPSPILFDESGMSLTLKFTLKNFGTVPATNVWPEWKIFLSSRSRDFLINLQRAICEEIKSRDRGKYADGFTIFPNESVDVVITTNIAQSEIEAELALKPPLPHGWRVQTITVNAIGCIDCRSALDPVHHQTGFAYYVSANKADGGKMMLSGPLLPIQKEPIPIGDLALSANILEGHMFFAD